MLQLDVTILKSDYLLSVGKGYFPRSICELNAFQAAE
jgi:hypothetical protein